MGLHAELAMMYHGMVGWGGPLTEHCRQKRDEHLREVPGELEREGQVLKAILSKRSEPWHGPVIQENFLYRP